VKLVLRKDDNGETYNRVRRFDVTGIEEIPRDAFAPDDDPDAELAADFERENPIDGTNNEAEEAAGKPF
jgi:hypothetical protein